MARALEVYAIGPVSASVCSSLTLREVTRQLNLEHPTGISSQWQFAWGEPFADGTPNPAPCGDCHRKHYLFHC